MKKQVQKEMGFVEVRTNHPYAPVFLRAQAQVKKTSNPKKRQMTSSTIGISHTKAKEFENGQWYDLWFMYGKDVHDNRCLFCREEQGSDVFKIIQGRFVFAFNAEAFAELAIYASRNNWAMFAQNCILTDEAEIEKFLALIDGKIRSNTKLHRIRNFINKLRNSL